MPIALLRNFTPKRRVSPFGTVGRSPSLGKTSLRPDIQGLRTFAVVAVILDHLLGWPSGGFVGVDIFFVISGFLITGLLLREHERTGRIAFGSFYRRRIKRILPAAVLVLVGTVIAGFFIFNKVRAWNTFWDGIWAFLFGANWRQTVVGTDYFAAGGPVSPLQHYWSLAVEEQFYFVWPWLMLALFALTGRLYKGRANPRVVAGMAMAVLTLGSLAWSIWDTATNPSVAYFSTFSRAWELGVGALLACSASILPRMRSSWRPFLAWIGIAGMVASLFLIDPQKNFPGPSALLPVLSTALVIAAGTGTSEHKFLWPLTNPVSRYIGDVSYSLYLWHFPVIIFASALNADKQGFFHNMAAFTAMLLLSVFAYHLVEDPIRKSRWLSGERHWLRHVSVPDSYKVTALAALATVTAIVVGAAMVAKPPVEQGSLAQPAAVSAPNPTASAATPTAGPEVTALQRQIATALSATSWPENLIPTMDEAVGNHEAPAGVAECGKTVAPSLTDCVWGDVDAPKTAVVVGDSVGVAWVPALMGTYAKGDWKLLMRAQFGCPFAERAAKNETADCAKHKQATISDVQQIKPDLLIVANNYPDSGDAPAWARGGTAILAKAGAKSTVVLSSPPHDKDVQKCYKPGSAPRDCVSVVNSWYTDLTFAERRAFEDAGAKYVNTTPLFCSSDGICPAFVGETPVKLDQVHMTLWYGEKVAPALNELIRPLP
ncbi:acyltransferase family protein [Arthrobacter sp. CJ23]|uniref:acyltransferase family protein n=1 Tax=Arthrobacter sp. CJ23 TaxID=2972479 RepID=UPI00215CBFE3|nr:acyltransferase family protein [Arthrobacter sp. CJ23]UVJ38735.1 acyltransferase family protein [Arthrobacter sp. CJ23]